MAVDPNLETQMKRVDDEGNAIGATVQPIADRLAQLAQQLSVSMSPEEQKAAADRLQQDSDALDSVAQALTALGQNPANPVPVSFKDRAKK